MYVRHIRGDALWYIDGQGFWNPLRFRSLGHEGILMFRRSAPFPAVIRKS